jgi:hypothetical protein
MNKRQILASLNKIANELDNSRLYKEATSVTSVMKKIAQEVPSELHGDFSGIHFYDESTLGRNLVKNMMKIIAASLRGNKEAEEYYKGGNLQSVAMAILDLAERENAMVAVTEFIKSRTKYLKLGEPQPEPLDSDAMYRTIDMYLKYIKEQREK